MGGGDLPDYAITELNSGFEAIYLHHLAGSPFNCSGMTHHITAFNNHVLSSSDWVNNNFSLPLLITPGISATSLVRVYSAGEEFHVSERCGLFQRNLHKRGGWR
jgi:hypothetical protein